MRLRRTAATILALLLLSAAHGQRPATAPHRPAAAAHRAAAPQDTRIGPDGYIFLRFSRDGSLLRVIGTSPGDTVQKQHVRAVTYTARTGTVLHVINLPPDSNVFSVTADGAAAIVATDSSTPHMHLFLLNTATGQRQPIPDSWYQPDQEYGAYLSGDGRLVSIYSETNTPTPMTVNVYDWATKKLVATRTSEFVAAGGFVDGGVTADGEVEFEGNRVGSKIVDLKTGRVMAQFGPSSERSPDGAWQVQFPNHAWSDDGPTDVQLKNGATGETIGKLDYTAPENELNGSLTGTFCGTSGRFILFGGHTIAVYELPSGKLLEELSDTDWRDPNDSGFPAVACSNDGKHIAILDGVRLTFHACSKKARGY